MIVLALSILLNMFFAFHYYQEQKKDKGNLAYATELILRHMDSASDRLTTNDEEHPDYRNNIIGATRDIATSQGWITAYGDNMPQNLMSWIGGVEVGLGNGAYEIDEEGFENAVRELEDFIDGYHKEAGTINPGQDPVKALKKMEDVISSKKYMGDNFIYK